MFREGELKLARYYFYHFHLDIARKFSPELVKYSAKVFNIHVQLGESPSMIALNTLRVLVELFGKDVDLFDFSTKTGTLAYLSVMKVMELANLERYLLSHIYFVLCEVKPPSNWKKDRLAATLVGIYEGYCDNEIGTYEYL